MDHEQNLAASYYGRFFVKALNLYTLKRRPAEWRDMVGKAKAKEEEQVKPEVKVEEAEDKVEGVEKPKRKRKHEQVDEIEMVFKKVRKKGALEKPVEGEEKPKQEKHMGMLDARVMEAIRSAPAEG